MFAPDFRPHSPQQYFFNKKTPFFDPMDLSSLLYAPPDLMIAEIINIVGAVATYHLLAKKNKNGWLFYLLGSFGLIYLLWFKDSHLSVVNQCMMVVLGIKNYFYFDRPTHKLHPYFDKLAIAVFLGSLFLINGLDGKSISEVLLWTAIIGKTILLGKENTKGWYFQIIQQLLSIVFGLYRDIYMYVIKGLAFAIQGIWGLLKWKKII